jgi:transposase-like protein
VHNSDNKNMKKETCWSRRSRFSPQTMDQAVQAAREKTPIVQIARNIGTTHLTVRKWLRKAEQAAILRGTPESLLPGPKARVHPRVPILADLMATNSDGSPTHTKDELAVKWGTSRKFLENLAREHRDAKDPRRLWQHHSERIHEQAIQAAREKTPLAQIAQDIGVHRNTIYKWLRKAEQKAIDIGAPETLVPPRSGFASKRPKTRNF